MNVIKRYLPNKKLPSYIFIPGENPHPKKIGGHMEGEKDPVADPIDPQHPEQNSFLAYALDLYNHHYYWESHVYFEAIWNTHKRVGSIADFCKAMIKLGAAGVKQHTQQSQSVRGHLLRAQELFEDIRNNEGARFLGFDLEHICTQLVDLLDDTEDKRLLTLFPIHPDWR